MRNKLCKIVLVLFMSAMVLIVGYRCYFISLTPEIDIPFDKTRFGKEIYSAIEGPNAFADYARAVDILNQVYPGPEDPLFGEIENLTYDEFMHPLIDWSVTSEVLISQNKRGREAFKHWLEGTEKKWSTDNPGLVNELTGENVVEELPNVDQWDLEGVTWCVALETSRLISLEKYDAAWQHCGSLFKFACQPDLLPHLGYPCKRESLEYGKGPLEVLLSREGLTGQQIENYSSEFAKLEKSWPADSQLLKAACCNGMDYLNGDLGVIERVGNTLTSPTSWEIKAVGYDSSFRRLVNLAYQNALEFADLPVEQQPPIKDYGELRYYDIQEPSLAVTPNELMHAFYRISEVYYIHASVVLPPLRLIPNVKRFHATYHEGGMMMFALHKYHRDHGQFPSTLNELVPDYVDQLPADPFNPAQVMSYRKSGEHAVLWSVGPDQVDQQGRRDFYSLGDNWSQFKGDVVFSLWKPGTTPAEIIEAQQTRKK